MLLTENKMGENHNIGPIPALLSVLFAFFALITLDDVKVWLSIASAVAALFCAILGGYNHWLAIKEKRKAAKNNL